MVKQLRAAPGRITVHLLYCDETNLEEKKGDFFVYGGLVIDASSSRELSQTIDKIRKEAQVPTAFKLKFNPGPPGHNHQQFIELKKRMIEAAIASEAKLLISVILHDIATTPDMARLNAINTICYHFDCVLHRLESQGLVLVDRFSDKQLDAHLVEKFSIGVVGLPHTPQLRLTNIVGFHYAAIGQSHFSSLIDVVLGSLRFAINAHTRNDEKNLAAAGRILEGIAPLFHRETDGAPVSELGFFYSPKIVKVQTYREKYVQLGEFLKKHGVETAHKVQSE
jgi:hypothetical protein